jgi:hypothetical protein
MGVGHEDQCKTLRAHRVSLSEKSWAPPRSSPEIGGGCSIMPELTAEQLAVAVRGHWAVENRLHWVLDVSFGGDASTVRKDNAPQNLSLLKKIVLNLIRLDTTDQKKTSLRLKRKAAAWDDDFRVKIMGLIRL